MLVQMKCCMCWGNDPIKGYQKIIIENNKDEIALMDKNIKFRNSIDSGTT